MKKQVTRLLLWVMIFAAAAGAAFYIHAAIDKSGDNTVMTVPQFFSELGAPFPLSGGVISCVISRLDGTVSSSGTGYGDFGSEESNFAISPEPRWKFISGTRSGDRIDLTVERCTYADVEFSDLKLSGRASGGPWRFTAVATVPLTAVAGTRLPADTRIIGARVNGTWTPDGLSFTADDGSFSYTSSVACQPALNADEEGEAVRTVRIELLSQSK